MMTQSDVHVFRVRRDGLHNDLLRQFLAKLKQEKSARALMGQGFLDEFRLLFERHKALFHEAKPEIERHIRSEAPDFNVFTILRFERYEVLTHTPFLACLLSPFGPHGQGPLFLRSFLTEVLCFREEEGAHPLWYVTKESEFIDLRMANETLKMAVFIENKIDTQAHSGQLSRYFAMWKSRYNRGAFVYLTPDGTMPPEEGFDNSVCDREEVLREMKLLSYRHDIANWLRGSLGGIQSPKVSVVVAMYVSLIEKL